MIGNLIQQLSNYFIKHALLFFGLLVLTLGGLSYGISRLNIEQDIFSTLPNGEAFDRFSTLIENKGITNQVIFTVNFSNDSEAYEPEDLVRQLSDTLGQLPNDFLTRIKGIQSSSQDLVYNYVYNNFSEFADEEYYQALDSKIKKDSIEKSINSGFRQLISPSGSAVKKYILNDPLFLTSDYFLELNENSNQQNLKISDGVIRTEDGKHLIITAEITFSPSESAKNQACAVALDSCKASWNNRFPSNKMDYFGTFLIAAENAKQVKADTIVTITITIIAALLILIGYYRNITLPLFFILPCIFGASFSLGVLGFIRPDISGISLATGAILFGVILDYSFHFFTHYKHSQSIKETVKELSNPLLIGSFTTVTAFVALLFTNSKILQDFGAFASLSLLGAALFTLIGLPVFLSLFRFKMKPPKETNSVNTKIIGIPKKYYAITLIVIFAITGVLAFYSTDVAFDGKIENLGYHPQHLKDKEELFMKINPSEQKKIYAFAQDSSFETAATNSYALKEALIRLRKDSSIDQYLNPSEFVIPRELASKRRAEWKKYWNNNWPTTKEILDSTTIALGFSSMAFDNFSNWIESPKESTITQDSLLDALGLNRLISHSDGKFNFISTIILPSDQLDEVKAQLSTLPGIVVFDKSEIATSLLDMIRFDFNFLLLVSGGIVFLTLLIIYGRIELTLISFLPMAISWVWILGAAALLGIPFNFVNVIVATFIFGLGDDFSIFVTDGLLHRYKYKKNILSSYNSAILLSAITTIIGTGALIFAKHPAIHSIALISVLGISCILIISLIFQPLLFNIFIQSRVDKGLAPITLFRLIKSISSFLQFTIGCLLLYFNLGVSYLLFLSPKARRRFMNLSLSYFAKTILFTYFGARGRAKTYSTFDPTHSQIIIANHTSFLDILLLIQIHPKIVLLAKGWVFSSYLFGPIIRKAGYLHSEEPVEENLEKMKTMIAEGYSFAVFPEGTRSKNDTIARFRKGAFYLAAEFKLNIRPVLIHGAHQAMPKNDFMISGGILSVKILPEIGHDDPNWGTGVRERSKSISKYFKEEYQLFKKECVTPRFIWNDIIKNYLFKGPVLEWYLRVKWQFEKDNFEHYDQLIGERKSIYDIGCGYGYLSYYLHFKSPNRDIKGIDYDQEKIDVAQACLSRTNSIEFLQGDVNQIQFETSDCFIFNDVLHYMSAESQENVLNNCLEKLNPNGLVIIRDGVTDLNKRHDKTELTERYSTQILGFNKKVEEFHFFSTEFIRTFADQNQLELHIEEQSQKTSNILFILKKHS